MYNDLLISSIKKFVGQKVVLEVDGFMTVNSIVNNFEYDFYEDILYIKNNENCIMSFNSNQISNIVNLDNVLKIIMDLDLTINIKR